MYLKKIFSNKNMQQKYMILIEKQIKNSIWIQDLHTLTYLKWLALLKICFLIKGQLFNTLIFCVQTFKT